VNPVNTNEVVAGTVMDDYFYSYDGGFSWNSGKLSSPYGVYGDPAIVIDGDGNYYYFHLADPYDGNWIDRIVCQKSEDAGVSWSSGSYMGLNGEKAQDKHWPVIDYSNNNIYVTWTQFDSYGSSSPSDFSNIHFSKSTDGGETWDQIYDKSCKHIVYNPVFPELIAAVTFNTDQILLSRNGGASWSDFTGNFPTDEFIKDLVFTEDGLNLIATSYYDIYSKEIIMFTGVDDATTVDLQIKSQSAPNPFAVSTSIKFNNHQNQNVKIQIFDITGKQIRTLKSDFMTAGKHTVVWDGKNDKGTTIEGGIYFYSISMEDGKRETKRIIKL